MEKKTRQLKVYSASVQTGSQSWYRGGNYKQVPQIRLQGEWLQKQCGIEIGDEIFVECKDDILLIRKTSKN